MINDPGPESWEFTSFFGILPDLFTRKQMVTSDAFVDAYYSNV